MYKALVWYSSEPVNCYLATRVTQKHFRTYQWALGNNRKLSYRGLGVMLFCFLTYVHGWQVSQWIEKEWPYEDIPYEHQCKVHRQCPKKNGSWSLRGNTSGHYEECLDDGRRNKESQELF